LTSLPTEPVPCLFSPKSPADGHGGGGFLVEGLVLGQLAKGALAGLVLSMIFAAWPIMPWASPMKLSRRWSRLEIGDGGEGGIVEDVVHESRPTVPLPVAIWSETVFMLAMVAVRGRYLFTKS